MGIITGGKVIEGALHRRYDNAFISASNAPASNTYVCDGIADEVQINAALAANSVVILGAGTYTISSSIVIPSNKKLIGQGVDITTITLANGANVHAISSSGTTNPMLADLTIDGNASNQTSNGRGINFASVTDGKIERVKIVDCYDNSVNLSSNIRTNVKDCIADSTTISGVGIQAYQGTGVQIESCKVFGHSSSIQFDQHNNGLITECYTDMQNLGHGCINLKGNSSGNRVIDNFATGMSNGHSGIEVYGSYNIIDGNTVRGSTLNNATGYGIEVVASASNDAKHNVISNNQVINVREIGISIAQNVSGAVDHNRILNNILIDTQTSNKATHGIKEDSPADYNDIHYNTVIGFATANITVTGSNTLSSNNRVA